MRVLYVIDTLGVGGSERSILDIASCADIEPIVCAIYNDTTLRAEFESRHIEVYALGVDRKYAFGEVIRRLRQLMSSVRPDVVHTTLFRADVSGRIAAKSLGIPVVSSFVNENYGVNHRRHLDGIGRLKNRGVQVLDAMTARLVDRFQANSSAMKTAHVSALRLDPGKIRVIYRGRNIDRFSSRPSADRGEARRSLSSTGPVVLMVARLLRRKAQNDLIEAMLGVQRRHPGAQCLLVGDGPHRAHLETLAATLHAPVQFLGTRQDIPALLASSDVFVSTSEYEGHPGAVVEAMLSGRPIVLSDIPVHAECVIDGVSGLLFPLHDVAALTDAISRLLTDRKLADALGERAQREASRRFDISRIAAEHVELYREAIAT